MSSSETPQSFGESDADRTVEMGGISDSSLPSDARPTETSHGIEPRIDVTIPKRIGHYDIKRAIGSGGMGTVYEATQERPRRSVAVKVMRHGVTSRSALKRFEQESQLLARLHHPGIAQVYEAGTHESPEGLVPFFAMEFIPGAEPLTAYAQKSSIGVRQRIELFQQVCDAVEHGHQCGIIHRDLKPSNILVDTTGRVKIIDFGVARATDSDIAVTTMQTDVGQLIGTLQYMSPEQCEADPSKIDPRSDVYALGVVLFELLCGRLPYNISHVPVYEAARRIREQPPTRLSTVSRVLRGDIETIVAKALEKDRNRRYPSASAMSQDLEHYLGNEPIIARRPTVTYRVGKFVQKRKALVVGGLLLAFSLLLAAYFQNQARRSAASATRLKVARLVSEAHLESQRDPNKAVEKLDEALAISPDYLEAMINRAYTLRRANRGAEAQAAAKTIVDQYPERAGPAHVLLVESYRDLDPATAEFHRKEAARLLPKDAYYQALALDGTESRRAIALLTEVIDADVLNSDALWARAWRYREVKDWEAMLADSQTLTVRWPETAMYWNAKGIALARLYRYSEAIDAYTNALQLRPASAFIHLNRADTYQKISMVSMGSGSQRALQRAIKDCTVAIQRNPELMRAYTLRAECHLLKRDYAGAWPDCLRALELDPHDTYAILAMGHVQVGRGQFEDALSAYEKGMKDDTGRGRDFFYRARMRRIAGQLESSLRDCDRAVEAEPGRAFVVASRAVTRRMLGDRVGAIEDLKKAISLNPLDWALQGNLMIWDIHALDGDGLEVDPARTALADAEASEEATKSRFGRFLSDLCTGRQSAESVFSQVEGDMEECLTAYFAGVRSAVDGRTTDAEAWFKRCKDTPAHGEFFVELASWHLQRVASD